MVLSALLSAWIAAAGTVHVDHIAAHQAKVTAGLPAAVRTQVQKRYRGAMVVDRCRGRFSSDMLEEALTLLVPDAAGRYRRIVRLILPQGGELDELSWTAAEDFNTIDVPLPTRDDARKLFFGQLRCVRPAELQGFLAQFDEGFTRSTAAHLDLQHRDSVCFRFDATYNAWQCFGYEPGQYHAVRWGYQAQVD